MTDTDAAEYKRHVEAFRDQMTEIEKAEQIHELEGLDNNDDNDHHHEEGAPRWDTFKVMALTRNLGTVVGMVTEPDMHRMYMCELCVKGRPTSSASGTSLGSQSTWPPTPPQ